jgi:hypothetical protein
VAFQRTAPEQDVGIDFTREYAVAEPKPGGE